MWDVGSMQTQTHCRNHKITFLIYNICVAWCLLRAAVLSFHLWAYTTHAYIRFVCDFFNSQIGIFCSIARERIIHFCVSAVSVGVGYIHSRILIHLLDARFDDFPSFSLFVACHIYFRIAESDNPKTHTHTRTIESNACYVGGATLLWRGLNGKIRDK